MWFLNNPKAKKSVQKFALFKLKFPVLSENHSGVSVLASPELRDSNSSLQRAQSMDTNQWSGIKLGRQRASSVWSANSTALRVSITKALNQRNINGTARRPTTTTLLSLNPPGLRNGKVCVVYKG